MGSVVEVVGRVYEEVMVVVVVRVYMEQQHQHHGLIKHNHASPNYLLDAEAELEARVEGPVEWQQGFPSTRLGASSISLFSS